MAAPDYKQLFESSPVLSILLDRDFRIAAASDAFLAATMTTREAAVGKGVFEVFPSDPSRPEASGTQVVRELLERVLAERQPQRLRLQRYDVPRPQAQGGGFERRYWTAQFVPLPGPDGEVAYIHCAVEDATDRARDERLGKLWAVEGELVLDVTDRKAAEQGKREAEERYRMLIESLDAAFCVIEVLYDAEGRPHDYRILEVNPAFERQTGLRNATAKTIREQVPGHEQHWFDVYGSIAETGGAVRFVQEAKALGRWYDVFAFRVGGKGSRKVGVLFYDITERVRAQRTLQDEARRKDEFLATLAHELRNPLAPIRNAVSLLQLMSDEKAELRRVGDLIDRQVTQLARLVDDLLDVSRVTFGKVSLQRTPVDLREVVKDAVATSEPLLGEKSHRLTLELGNEPLWVDGDRVRLAQVVSNLLNNAARYTQRGGRITLEVAAAEHEARIAVEDNGIGIESSQLERVFEPFAQVDRGESAGAGGIGIGLALAKALVELHGGSISAHSAGSGRGSRFVVCLPRIAVPKPRTVVRAAQRDKRQRRLLVVDDNVDAATSQADLLRLLGHEVEVAYSGEDALEKAKAFSPEIVLLDLGMPGMDGFEVARRLRAAPGDKHLVLVAQTGWGQEEDRRRTREAGFDAHLAKPVDMASLQQLL